MTPHLVPRAGRRRPAHLICGASVNRLGKLVERVSFNRSPLPLKSLFHYRAIDSGWHCRYRVVGDAREVIPPLALNADGQCKSGKNGTVGSA